MADDPISGAGIVPGRYWHALDDGRLQCDVCPRQCHLNDGQRGLCYVRGRLGDTVVLTSYGRSSGFVIDPIEKKPLAHFLPGTPVLSFGTAGCNLTCKFCQNWDISKSREADTLAASASPEALARAASLTGCRSIAFTYNDPVIFLEYAVDVAAAARAKGLKTVAVTAGYVGAGARVEFFAAMDAANVDLKAFDEKFYRSVTGAHLEAVKETLVYLAHDTRVWTEITTLLIPGMNDSDGEIDRMTGWIAEALGRDVPLHFSAFHPDYRMRDVPATPPATLRRARDIAKRNGLHHVYVGNVHDPEADSTWCAGCGAKLIGRDWYQLTEWRLTAQGTCPDCGTRLPGVFEARPGDWGRRRQVIDMSRFSGAPAAGKTVS